MDLRSAEQCSALQQALDIMRTQGGGLWLQPRCAVHGLKHAAPHSSPVGVVAPLARGVTAASSTHSSGTSCSLPPLLQRRGKEPGRSWSACCTCIALSVDRTQPHMGCSNASCCSGYAGYGAAGVASDVMQALFTRCLERQAMACKLTRATCRAAAAVAAGRARPAGALPG